MRANLLLIETDNLFRMNLTRRLDGERFRVFPANRPAVIKRLIKKNKIDVALLDLSGLKLEGLNVLRLIKKLKPLTEVILLNTTGNMALSIEGMKLGAFDDLLIPLNINTLIQRIESAYSQKKENEKRVRLKGYQKVMMAATFAEAGEPETAKAYLNNCGNPTDSNSKGER